MHVYEVHIKCVGVNCAHVYEVHIKCVGVGFYAGVNHVRVEIFAHKPFLSSARNRGRGFPELVNLGAIVVWSSGDVVAGT